MAKGELNMGVIYPDTQVFHCPYACMFFSIFTLGKSLVFHCEYACMYILFVVDLNLSEGSLREGQF